MANKPASPAVPVERGIWPQFSDRCGGAVCGIQREARASQVGPLVAVQVDGSSGGEPVLEVP
jgi:hypothetical protein